MRVCTPLVCLLMQPDYLYITGDALYRPHTQIPHSQEFSALRGLTLGTSRSGAHRRLQAALFLQVQ